MLAELRVTLRGSRLRTFFGALALSVGAFQSSVAGVSLALLAVAGWAWATKVSLSRRMMASSMLESSAGCNASGRDIPEEFDGEVGVSSAPR